MSAVFNTNHKVLNEILDLTKPEVVRLMRKVETPTFRTPCVIKTSRVMGKSGNLEAVPVCSLLS